MITLKFTEKVRHDDIVSKIYDTDDFHITIEKDLYTNKYVFTAIGKEKNIAVFSVGDGSTRIEANEMDNRLVEIAGRIKLIYDNRDKNLLDMNNTADIEV